MSIQNQISQLHSSLPESVTLVAVSKMQPIESLRQAYEAGARIFGESRPQEMCAKQAEMPADCRWHMIGHLQTNKVKYIAPFVELIHSVDSPRLLDTINREAMKCGRRIDVLLEVHLAKEESKSGFAVEELREYLASESVESLAYVRVRGLMTIASNTDNQDVIASEFKQLKKLFEELKSQFGKHFDTLSMGMTSDYPLAIECGSTMVRIGSLIFGERNY